MVSNGRHDSDTEEKTLITGGKGGVAGKNKKDAQKQQQPRQTAAATDAAKTDGFKKA